ncbi:MAG TPA: hypothetical protein VI978_01995 [Candidatus Paceibacterota bacterium]
MLTPVLKKVGNFRLNEFDTLQASIQESLVFSKPGKQVRFFDLKMANQNDIIRLTSSSGSIFLLEVVEPQKLLLLVCGIASPYLYSNYKLSCSYLGECLALGSKIENGEDFLFRSFLAGNSGLHRVYRIKKIEILESHQKRLPTKQELSLFLHGLNGSRGRGEVF